ncbi:ParA family protein [Telluribacter sp. SYSU D00476]|uniref:ParA family protein n=1 Tax=Telluribacter sp. SYSU D00476 TaxID=2811430 RepID=UPI001FF31D9B|nr:ParA family protein [Telluribacter sp. SYSU D00476]
MKVISITNNKGGTGKTTTSYNLGAALANRNHKVLLIDLDAQCNLTIAAGVPTTGRHIGELLLGEAGFDEVVVKKDGFDLLPAHRMLLSYEYRINTEPDSGFFLSENLEGKDYDFVIIDCPPSLGSLTVNALVASDYFVVPMQGENFAYVGLDEILQLTAKIRRRMNPRIKLAGILFNRFDMRTKFGQMVLQKLMQNPMVRVFETSIRQDVSLMESTAFAQSIFAYAPDSRGASDFSKLCDELLELYGEEKIQQ